VVGPSFVRTVAGQRARYRLSVALREIGGVTAMSSPESDQTFIVFSKSARN
jgi:hypothetical protein